MKPDAAHSSFPVERVLSGSRFTPAQQLLWLGQQLEPKAALYNMVMTFDIEGPLDPALFSRAFGVVVASSDALRTVVRLDADGVPQPHVLERVDATLELADLSSTSDPGQEVRDWIDRRRDRAMDLSERLFDAALLRVSPGRHVWYLAQHHLITDGWSVALVYERTAAAYRALAAGESSAATDWPSHAAYAAHVRRHRESRAFAEAEEYWRQALSIPHERLELYSARRQETSRSHRVVVALGRARTLRLRELARQPAFKMFSEDLAIYGLFMTVVAVWLFRLGHNRRFAVGMPSHNRASRSFKQTIGLFIEISPVQVECEETDTFASLYRRIAGRVQDAMLRTQPGTTTAAHNRAYEVLLNFVNVSFAPFNGWPTRIDWVHAGFGDRGHALRLQIADFNAEGQHTLHFDFNAGAFTPIEREHAVRDVLRFVDRLLEQPDAQVASTPWLTGDETRELVHRFNAPVAIPRGKETVLDVIAGQVERNPDAPAVGASGRTLTYSALSERANALAQVLRGAGVGPDTVVPIVCEHSAETVPALVGILRAGGAFLPLDPKWPRERLALLLDEVAGSSGKRGGVVVAQPRLAECLPRGDWNVVGIDLQSWPRADETRPLAAVDAGQLAYVLYTSGSTGRPKGVMIEHGHLASYLAWAQRVYAAGQPVSMPLFTALTFDLTVTSLFLPLVTGGRVVVYRDDDDAPGSALFNLVRDDDVDVIKLTPAHLSLLAELPQREMSTRPQRVRTLIVGGEDLKTASARIVASTWRAPVAIFNEYGPTEATVGSMVHRFDPEADTGVSVPIGQPADHARIYLLDRYRHPVPPGVVGELAIGGAAVARGYFGRPDLTAERFVGAPHLLDAGAGGGPHREHAADRPELDATALERIYLTGDLARWTPHGQLEFLGRRDDQVKVAGVRIELGEVEAALRQVAGVRQGVVVAIEPAGTPRESHVRACTRCGLASNYPDVSFDEAGVCTTCRAFDSYGQRASIYFRPLADLERIVTRMRATEGSHDCLVLFSGGKDSTYMLCRLVDMGVRPLAFTLDNGYISESAKTNIRRVTDTLGVAQVFGSTPAMPGIFAESLRVHANVCNGCFKTIYTLAVGLARERRIRFIVTGLSRGQFFETRLTEDLFKDDELQPADVDRMVLEARKAYHRRDDAVSRSLDVDVFRSDQVFDDIEFVDFYRYCDVDLTALYSYLDQRVPWVRPSDTGRSTNCRINDVGIWVHKRRRGFHNYALPYSWDVRLGHKTRAQALSELDDAIDEDRVRQILDEIGYDGPIDPPARGERRLAAYFVADRRFDEGEMRAALSDRLPPALVPSHVTQLDALPLTSHGKVDRNALPRPGESRGDGAGEGPRTPLEARLSEIWAEVLRVSHVGVHDNFFDLGGDSIQAIRVVTRAARVGVRLAPGQLFRHQTVADLAAVATQSTEARVVDGDQPTDEVPLTAMQRDILAQQGEIRSWLPFVRWGDIEMPSTVGRVAVEAALCALVERHDALRLAFDRVDGVWTQTVRTRVEPPVAVVDLRPMPLAERAEARIEAIRTWAASADLTRPPLLIGMLVIEERATRVGLATHHLIADASSLARLVAELSVLCDPNSASHAAPDFAPGSFVSWARQLARTSLAGQGHGPSEYRERRLAAAGSVATDLALDESQPADPASSAWFTVSGRLQSSLRAALLGDVQRSLRAEPSEVFLAALIQTVRRSQSSATVVIDVERDGRRAPLGDVDHAHTIGNCSVRTPLVLHSGFDDSLECIRIAKEAWRAWSRVETAEEDGTDAGAPSPRGAGVSDWAFSYRGPFATHGRSGASLQIADVRPHAERCQLTDPRSVMVGIRASASSIDVDWTAHASARSEAELRTLHDSYVEVLAELASEHRDTGRRAFLPSDFPLADVSHDELDDILREFGEQAE